jgi:hypothetical protein
MDIMNQANGHEQSVAKSDGFISDGVPAAASAKTKRIRRPRVTAARIPHVVAELEIPFEPSLIEWRSMKTCRDRGTLRGLFLPYADQRAYTDRLNGLFTPAGWTRNYSVHSSGNFERSRDRKVVAKVFVTCQLTIFGLGSHAATGEEWIDDENAGTSAEAQAFKRACSCFGLGRYLYYFSGIWLDADEHRRPKTKPELAGWATPEGWRQGLRPVPDAEPPLQMHVVAEAEKQTVSDEITAGERGPLIRQIEAMAEPLGRSLYRGILKTAARAWQPAQIQDLLVLEAVLAGMKTAESGLRRLQAALEQTGSDSLAGALHDLNLRSMHEVNDLERLDSLIAALEARAQS